MSTSTNLSEQQQQAAKAAVDAIKAAQQTLQDLGISGGNEGPKIDPLGRAPDGGPISHASAFLKPHRVPTMEVYALDEDGNTKTEQGAMTICVSDFDADLHAKIEKRRARTTTSRRVESETKSAPQLSKQELSMMSMSKLRAQPEVSRLGEVPKDKASLIDAILALQ